MTTTAAAGGAPSVISALPFAAETNVVREVLDWWLIEGNGRRAGRLEEV
jgi:hypothetical protein